ncbi:MAG: EamA family transporter [Saprospiraceae bacterium]|nr:EamA family transporter [Saprospiraceae bacterium]
MDPTRRAWMEMHLAVLCFGFTAILGAWISLSALSLVWWRVLLTSLSLMLLLRGFGSLRRMPIRLMMSYAGIGVLVAIHWVAFYGAIKLSNASITLVCMATTSLFTAFLEPLFTRQRLRGVEVVLGLMMVPGMILVIRHIEPGHWYGVLAGLAAALLASIFSILNKQLVSRASEMEITLLELGSALDLFVSGTGGLSLAGITFVIEPAPTDWLWLIVLALVCTTLAYILALRALRHLSAFASNLTINLEPVYGIILAIVLLGEHHELDLYFYLGVAMILGAVLLYPWLKRRWV